MSCCEASRPAQNSSQLYLTASLDEPSAAALAAGFRSPPNSGINSTMAPVALGQTSWKIIPAFHHHLSCVWSTLHTEACFFRTRNTCWFEQHKEGNIQLSVSHSALLLIRLTLKLRHSSLGCAAGLSSQQAYLLYPNRQICYSRCRHRRRYPDQPNDCS